MSWDDGKHTKVKRVQLTFDDVIRSIEVEYDGTSLKSQPRGPVGTTSDGFTLSSDEYVTEVNGYYKTTFSGEVITSLTFKTNKRTYGTYGNKTRNYFSVTAPKDNQIVGFLGSSSHALNSINAHFAPVHPSGSTGTKPGASGIGSNEGGEKSNTGGQETITGGKETNTGGKETNTGAQETNTGSEETNTGAQETNTGSEESNTGGKETNTGGKESNTGGKDSNTGGKESNTGGKETNTGGKDSNTGGKDSNTGGKDSTTGSEESNTGGKDSNTGSKESNTAGKDSTTGSKESNTGGKDSNTGSKETNTGGKESNTGSESNTSSSPQKLEAQGGKEGNQWDDGADHDGVMKIHVAAGGLGIEQISFDYVKNGQSKEGPFHGVKGRSGSSTFVINHPEEYLVSVEGWYDSSNIIQGIQFQSNKHTSQYFGYVYSGDGKQFSLQVNDKKIIGFHGFADSHLNSLGAYFVPISSSSSSLTPPPNKVKAQGGNYGETFDDGAFDHVRKVYVGQGDSGVAYVKFDYEKDGKIETREHGQMTLLATEEFEVDLGDYITSMEVYVDKVYGYKSEIVVALTFKTFKGKTSPRFGVETENKYEVKDGKGGKLAGFHGKASDVLYALGAYFTPTAN
ncbi:Jacalin-like lectin domain [Arabidopsis thaliana x Arabidopsis arenosa]|uniref:Jacalin-like lectin domain n=1 Tax=Arabidopsis thaliana x Arabidopsis arenosa TaxID=1240361 RepID=A0A8T2CIE9_9BRAS|nr:Jacalin-like lectin domain [Arabidopsis thaliana x Arabidopsis arenosa]